MKDETTTPRVLVSIPYAHKDADVIARAVNSIDRGPNPTIVVTADGHYDRGPLQTTGPVIFHTLPKLGRYFIDAVTSRAGILAGYTHWTTHDADDWSAPHRLSTLLAVMDETGADVVVGGEQVHGQIRTTQVSPKPTTRTRQIRHNWHMSALYRLPIPALIIHPEYPVGWDSLMSMILAYCGDVKVAYDHAPTYHREKRAGSLTTDPKTNFGSATRAQAVAQMGRLWRKFPTAYTYDQAVELVKGTINKRVDSIVDHYAHNLAAVLTAHQSVTP